MATARQAAKTSRTGTPYGITGFDFHRIVGQGAFGEVWLARTTTGSWRAVKIVPRMGSAKKRFELEYEAVRQFVDLSRQCDHLIHILHAEINTEAFWYVMDAADDVKSARSINPDMYIPRTLFHDMKKKRVLPVKDGFDIITRITRATAFLHDKGLVHRDIKPDNIIFIDGAAKLADVGLAADVMDPAFAYGTHGYAPPEKDRTPAGDVHGLGKVLYEMLCGQPAARFPDTPVNDADTDHPAFGALNQVIHAACDRDPGKRYGDARKLLKALQAAKDMKTIEEPPIVEPEPKPSPGPEIDKEKFKLSVIKTIDISITTVLENKSDDKKYLEYPDLQKVTVKIRDSALKHYGNMPKEVEVALMMSEATLAPLSEKAAILKAAAGVGGGAAGIGMVIAGIGLALGWGQGMIAVTIALFTGSSVLGPIALGVGGLSALSMAGVVGYFTFFETPQKRHDRVVAALKNGVSNAIDSVGVPQPTQMEKLKSILPDWFKKK